MLKTFDPFFDKGFNVRFFELGKMNAKRGSYLQGRRRRQWAYQTGYVASTVR